MPRDWEIPEASEEDEDEFGPGSPDYDLSEAHGYMWEPKRQQWPVPGWALVVVSIIVVIALVLPTVVILAR